MLEEVYTVIRASRLLAIAYSGAIAVDMGNLSHPKYTLQNQI